jgi:hypothetical protein
MGKQAFMPGFGGRPTDANPLSNRDITALGNYVLTHFGAAGAAITEQQVAEVRRGGPSSPLLMLARGGMAAAKAKWEVEKADRPAHRVIAKNRFASLDTIDGVIARLIGV